MLKSRIAFLLYTLSLFVLIDEYVTQGYILDPVDFINPRITHEKIWLVLLIAAIALSLRSRNPR
ncbi:hypothetical protein ATG_13090 [Desulfurococcaceae archaeon AG1]|nr:hypothetical protein ATG_13090 [Desulfurococcaceae archaeon AG1]